MTKRKTAAEFCFRWLPISDPGLVATLAVAVFTVAGTTASAQSEAVETDLGPVQVYARPEQASAELFPDAAMIVPEVRSIEPDLRAAVTATLGRVFDDDSLRVYIAYDQSDLLLGRAVVSDEIGKYRPITFMVGLDVDFVVTGAAILVYRESRGGEVRRSRFLRQYRGKSSGDPIRINRDIVNITGATMSVRALNFGIRKIILLTEGLYGGSAEHTAQTPSP